MEQGGILSAWAAASPTKMLHGPASPRRGGPVLGLEMHLLNAPHHEQMQKIILIYTVQLICYHLMDNFLSSFFIP